MRDEVRAKVSELVSRCRSAFENMTPAQRGVGFAEFPAGACSGASELVGRILLETLGLEATYVSARCHPELRSQQTHAWLEVDGLIVDVTHDQFRGTGLAGWVFDKSLWHANFQELERKDVCIPPRGCWPMYPYATYRALREALRRE